jgi:hypothetical protein
VEAPLPPCPYWSRVKRQLRRNFALRRLREDRPDLRARVFAGELSLHAAMIEAGWAQARKPNRWRVVQDASVSETQRATADGGLRDNVVPDLGATSRFECLGGASSRSGGAKPVAQLRVVF